MKSACIANPRYQNGHANAVCLGAEISHQKESLIINFCFLSHMLCGKS